MPIKYPRVRRSRGRSFPSFSLILLLAGLGLMLWGSSRQLGYPLHEQGLLRYATVLGAGVFANRLAHFWVRRKAPGWGRRLAVALKWAFTVLLALYVGNSVMVLGAARGHRIVRGELGALVRQIESFHGEQGRYPESQQPFLPVAPEVHNSEYVLAADGYIVGMELDPPGSGSRTWWYQSMDGTMHDLPTSFIQDGDPEAALLTAARENHLLRSDCLWEGNWECTTNSGTAPR